MVIYFPLLRWKMGERAALANLSPNLKNQIAPIIEFPLGCEYNNPKVVNFCNTVLTDWGQNRQYYLDLTTVDFEDAPSGNEHPALILFREAYQKSVSPIPIISIGMDEDLFDAIKTALTDGYFTNVAFRVLEDDDDTAANDASEMLHELGINHAQVDLIIDLGDISSGAIRTKMRILNIIVAAFDGGFRNSILLSGAIPSDLSLRLNTDSTIRIQRYDWALWVGTRNNPDLEHLLFGDYATIPCEFQEVPYQGAPKIKYTLDDEWFIIKGHKPRQRENQRQAQSLNIINSGFFRGSQNSYGENKIFECANGNWGPGNPTNWVTNDVNQHLTFVVSQVSSNLGVL